MEKKDFKKILKESLELFSFSKVKNSFYIDNDEVIAVVSTQKSNFDDAYYINYGFIVKNLHPEVEYPKDNQCDISARFSNFNESKQETTTLFEFKSIDPNELQNLIIKNVKESIIPVMESGLAMYFEINENAKAIATVKLKTYLNI